MAHARRILIVDGDDELRATLAEQFDGHAEFAACCAASAAEADPHLAGRPDLVILAVPLPDRDGLAMVRALRAEGFSAPVIALCGAVAPEDDIVAVLEAGANDCVSKPFRFAVLLARIRAHLRQHDGSEDAAIQVGPFTFKPSAKLLLTEAGARLRLTEKETAILRFLYRAGPQVVSRDVLLREVWGYNSSITTHTLETHIYRLRQKIEDDPTRARVLVTDAGGYRLMA